jgi:hypothetical protein
LGEDRNTKGMSRREERRRERRKDYTEKERKGGRK